jgi:hypothetical protein
MILNDFPQRGGDLLVVAVVLTADFVVSTMVFRN